MNTTTMVPNIKPTLFMTRSFNYGMSVKSYNLKGSEIYLKKAAEIPTNQPGSTVTVR